MEVASLRIGEKLSELYALEKFGSRVQKISESKWFIPDFISFQYGELNEKNRLHLSVINILNKYGIRTYGSPLEGPYVGPKDKEKDKEQYKVKDKDKVEGGQGETFLIPEMCNVWYKTFPTYTSDKKNDFEGMGKVLEFITRQANLKNTPDADQQIKILNTLQLIADKVKEETFWSNKSIKSIASNIQEFYNKIKNPVNGKQQSGSLRAEVQADRERRRSERQQAGT